MTSQFFEGNRRRLADKLQPNSALIMTAFTLVQRDADQPLPFYQESNFWYLSGIEEADWLLIIDADREYLVMPQVEEILVTFMGGITRDQAAARSGVTDIIDPKQADTIIKDLLKKRDHIYTLMPSDMTRHGFAPNPAMQKLADRLAAAKDLVDIRLPLAKLRAIKQPAELTAMQAAIDLTIDSLKTVLPRIQDFKFEYEAEAALTYEFSRRGSSHGFDPITATGIGLCTIHHADGRGELKQGGWLLFDVGAKVDGYMADISCTVPIGRGQTKREVQVYEAVQRVHDYAITMCRPGQNIMEYVKKVDQAMGEELVKLGLIKEINWDSVHKYFPHAIGHGLGVDVHDSLGKPKVFAENMVMTVEPGIYIPAESHGVRIENDILITKDGPKNLSAALPYGLDNLANLLY